MSVRRQRSLLALILLVSAWWVGSTLMAGFSPERDLEQQGAQWQVLRQAWVEGRPVSLPHRLDKNLAQDRWVDFTLPLQVAAAVPGALPLGLCVARWSLGAEVALDGTVLSRSAPGLDEALDYSRPQHVALPPGLSPGMHALTIRVHAWPGMDPGLSEVWLGEGQAMRLACGQLAERRRTQGTAMVFMLAAMGLASALLFWLFRERGTGWFALLALAWCFHASHTNAPDLPLSVDSWILVFFATRTLFAPPMILFCLALSGHDTRRPAWVLGALWGLALLLLPLLAPSQRIVWLAVMAGLALAGLAACLLLLLRWLQRTPRMYGVLLVVAFSVALIGNLSDYMRWLGWTAYGATSLAMMAVPLIFLSLAALLIERLQQHRTREALSLDLLRTEVERHRLRIASDFERLGHQRGRLLVLDERRRMVQDMHDLLGSQLLSAAVLLKAPAGGQVSRGQAAALVDQALLDLRCALDVLGMADADADPDADADDTVVSTLLGTLRWRMAPVFEARSITLTWHCDPLPADFLNQDRQRVDLMRLLQEALANALRHAQARQVRFSACALDADTVEIALTDDGVGFDPLRPGGIGLKSMRQRALALGTQLTLDSRPGAGTRIVLRWQRC